MGRPVEVDYFDVENRQNCDIRVDMLDYDYVEQSADVNELKGILALLRSGKEGKYVTLEHAVEARLLAVLPPGMARKIKAMQSGPSSQEQDSEAMALASWSEAMRTHPFSSVASKAPTSSVVLPPIRGSQKESNPKSFNSTTARVSTTTTTTTTENKDIPVPVPSASNARISAYNYARWEQYNAQDAEAEVDLQEAAATEALHAAAATREAGFQARLAAASASLPKEYATLSPAARLVVAGREKQKGNESFKCGELAQSLVCYTRSLALVNDTVAASLVYGNRALVKLQLSQFAGAEDDCDAALVLDPSYRKGWLRRGMVRHKRGHYSEAVVDFTKALSLSGTESDTMITRLMEKSKAKDAEVNGDKTTSSTSAPVTVTAPAPAPASGFQRMVIAEADSDDDDDEDFIPGSEYNHEAGTTAPRFEEL